MQSYAQPKKSWVGYVVPFLLLYVVLAMIVLWGVVAFSILGRVSGDSMQNTLHDGDYLLLQKHPKKIKDGDIVILPMPGADQEIDIVKRVIAVEGETVRFAIAPWVDVTAIGQIGPGNQEPIVLQKKVGSDFVTVDESGYIKEPMTLGFFYGQNLHYGFFMDGEYYPSGTENDAATREIPKGKIFVMGDNRNDSTDSRQKGAMEKSTVLGKQYARLKKGGFDEWVCKLFWGEL